MTEVTEAKINLLSPDVFDKVYAEAEKDKDIVVLSTGVTVRSKKVPDNLVMILRNQNPEPTPPMVTIDDPSGKSWDEENPNDPRYVRDLQEWNIALGIRMTDLIILSGMKVVSLPDGMMDYESDVDWEDELDALEIDIPTGKAARRLLWMKYRVAPNTEDLTAISNAYARSIGVSEEDVAVAEEQFRSDA